MSETDGELINRLLAKNREQKVIIAQLRQDWADQRAEVMRLGVVAEDAEREAAALRERAPADGER